MKLPIEELTPRQIVAELDKYIVGQADAKKAVAVALRNRYRRQQLPADERADVLPKNILMMGPTGVGKTEIARRLAQLARAPFVKVEATKFTEVGYVGRDVDAMVRDLVAEAVRLVEKERMDGVREQARERAYERIAELLYKEPEYPQSLGGGVNIFGFQTESVEEVVGDDGPHEDPYADWDKRQKEKEVAVAELKLKVEAGEMDSEIVEIDVEDQANPFVQVFSAQGIEEMGFDMPNAASPFGSRRTMLQVPVAEAKEILFEEEAKRAIDKQGVHREALIRAEQTGIIFIDEIDKVAGAQGGSGPDVSREGVQRDLLPIIEGSTVQSKFGSIKTDHILFIAAGAFHVSKPSELIPELQGRLPIRVTLDALHQADFRRILTEPKNALTKQYEKLLKVDGVTLTFTEDALGEIARLATIVNTKGQNIGARRLHTMVEKLLENALFEAPESGVKDLVLDGAMVRAQLEPIIADLGKSEYIL